VSFRGHRFLEGHVQLLYTLTCPDGSVMNFTETIEANHPNAGGVEFVRQFDFDRWSGWRPILLGPDEPGEPSPERDAAERQASEVNGEGVRPMVSNRDHPPSEQHSVVFRALTSTLRVRHDIDLRLPPSGVPDPGAEAETAR
jgi:hypothetical protein